MAPKRQRIKIVGEVPISSRPEILEEYEIVGTAVLERLPGGAIIAHIDASGMSADILRRGFSIGEFSIPDEEIAPISLQKGSSE